MLPDRFAARRSRNSVKRANSNNRSVRSRRAGTVTAWVNGLSCRQGQTQLINGQLLYTLNIQPDRAGRRKRLSNRRETDRLQDRWSTDEYDDQPEHRSRVEPAADAVIGSHP